MIIILPQRLRLARKAKKLTQEQLAIKVNTKKTTISNYETGYSSPPNEMLRDLANVLEVTADYLLERTNKPQAVLTSEQRDYIDKIKLDDEEILNKPIYRNGRELTIEEKRRFIRLLQAAVDLDQQ